jgi:Xaa-Pro dipeptidase
MGTATFGMNVVDWEARVDIDRLRDERLAKLKRQLDGSAVGALLTFDFHNIRYMTATHIGTWAMDKLIRFALLPRGGEPVLWDFGSAARHHQLYAPWLDYRTRDDVAETARGTSGARAGISVLRGAFHPDSGIAESVAQKAKGIEVVDGQQVFLEARRIKTEDEISLLTTAASMVDAAYDDLYAFLRPGVRENETVALVSQRLLQLGSEHVEGVNAISGERCSPHPHVFSDRLLRPGDPAFFDILHSFMGYRTCYYRTFAVGSASRAQVDAYQRCREYMDQAIELVRPGATTADIVSVWPTAQEFGFADEEAAFALQYGHGVGLSIWEKPVFSRLVSLDQPEVLEEGMVFALETYWPSADGVGAARIEEELVVTADGAEVITKFPAERLLVAGRRYYSTAGPLPVERHAQSHINNRPEAGV